MTYAVKEIFYTLQGEGANAGRPAVFCRFAGCNLWTGREEDRADAVCRFCDTDFVGTDGPGGGKFADADALARRRGRRVAGRRRAAGRFVVCTGGEPLLQLDAPLLDALHAAGFEVAVETNGTSTRRAGHRLGLRQPQGRGAAGGARRATSSSWSTRRTAPSPSAFEALDVRPLLPPAHGRAGPRGQHRARRCATAWPIRAGD